MSVQVSLRCMLRLIRSRVHNAGFPVILHNFSNNKHLTRSEEGKCALKGLQSSYVILHDEYFDGFLRITFAAKGN